MNVNHRTTWDTYAAAWGPLTSEARALALATSVDPENRYRDPLMETKGHQELSAYMALFQKETPGGHFETTWFLSHHDRSIAKWNMLGADGAVLGTGISYAVYGSSGLLTEEAGFFETPTA